MSKTVTTQPLPLHDAEWLFGQLGVLPEAACAVSFNPQTQIYYLRTRSGPCAVMAPEWLKYRRLCAMWRRSPLDLQGASTMSMEQPSDEPFPPASANGVANDEALSREDMGCIHASLLVTLKEARELVSAARQTLSLEDYEDALCAAFEKLSLSVGCLSAILERGAR